MSLSEGVAEREHLHTRNVTCQGFRRADGLWDIEGQVVDLKAYEFENHDRGTIKVGDPLHDMSLRLTLDDSFTIQAVEAVTDRAPYSICPAITPNYQRLVGVRIGPGFMRKARSLLGGVQGCTHLLELLGPMATTAFQTIGPVLAAERDGNISFNNSDEKPALLGSCHAFAPDSPVSARLWPDLTK